MEREPLLTQRPLEAGRSRSVSRVIRSLHYDHRSLFCEPRLRHVFRRVFVRMRCPFPPYHIISK